MGGWGRRKEGRGGIGREGMGWGMGDAGAGKWRMAESVWREQKVYIWVALMAIGRMDGEFGG